MNTLLQIVPRIPGGIDGVGDYALTIARQLRQRFNYDTVFATFRASAAQNSDEFRVLPLDRLLDTPVTDFDRVLLHYVNYGFQKRGVPFRLLSILRGLREQHPGRLITIFHELYASGPPWTSAFWLRPLQVDLAKSVASLSDACIVSSDHSRRELMRLAGSKEVELHPIPSGVGEPSLSNEQIADRDPHRWVIFGGTGLAERSLRSFRELMKRIPEPIAPRALFVIGGEDNNQARALLADLGIESTYRPQIAAQDASGVLRTCSFAWLDYFHRPDVETAILLKSSAFGSLCAHAVITVLPHVTARIGMHGDYLPGPFFVGEHGFDLPKADERASVATNIYQWYQRNASSECLINGVAEMLGVAKGSEIGA